MAQADSTSLTVVSDSDRVDAKEYVRRVVAESGTSFYWGMRILPPEKREAMYAIYAFCREVDDVADDVGRSADKMMRLAEWRAEIGRLYDGLPRRPITRALLEPIERFDLPQEEFLTIIEGMETDASSQVRITDQDQLESYCRQVAGAVGMLSVHVFGDTSPAARELAVVQGQALQITNILRDVAEDARRDRLYLPHELLSKHGIRTPKLDQILRHPNLPGALTELAHVARRRFQRADELLDQCDRKQMKPAILMLEMYRTILDRLEARGWQRFAQPAGLSKFEKIFIALRWALFT